MSRTFTVFFLLLGGLLVGGSRAGLAQYRWQPARLVLRAAPTDTLAAWARYYAGQVEVLPAAGGSRRSVLLPDLVLWQTAAGAVYEPTPARLARHTPAPVVQKLVGGPASLFIDESSSQQRYLVLTADSGYALPRNNYLQQLHYALPGCPATSPDSLEAGARRLRYTGRSLAPLVARYGKCRPPASPVQVLEPRSGARLQLGLWAGAQHIQLRYAYSGLLQDTRFANRTGPTAGLLARLTFNERLYFQPELTYVSLQGQGSSALPTGTTAFSRTTTSALKRQMLLGNLLARFHFGVPAGRRVRPVLLAGAAAGYALASHLTISTTTRFADGRSVEVSEPATAAPWAGGYVLGTGVELPLLRRRPTLELRYQAVTVATSGLVERPLQARLLQFQASWYW
ncbi:porin family protein [Hymenobacter weizhouensis]|uniref:outer membrane beta-barrel protein n=1 Tax=Hymenobacter sp. YIM 151500-1 TaxID=2987689 RepID=UPI002225B743|nr:outer membrane beta-barrel protein [Hymenobacter sp. YIM 151500-1]UYZ65047.1 outer membrane beta-barrel protein [Hymenobacter sp. YIM 151500-1]